jgi:hypothetical protein
LDQSFPVADICSCVAQTSGKSRGNFIEVEAKIEEWKVLSFISMFMEKVNREPRRQLAVIQLLHTEGTMPAGPGALATATPSDLE